MEKENLAFPLRLDEVCAPSSLRHHRRRHGASVLLHYGLDHPFPFIGHDEGFNRFVVDIGRLAQFHIQILCHPVSLAQRLDNMCMRTPCPSS